MVMQQNAPPAVWNPADGKYWAHFNGAWQPTDWDWERLSQLQESGQVRELRDAEAGQAAAELQQVAQFRGSTPSSTSTPAIQAALSAPAAPALPAKYEGLSGGWVDGAQRAAAATPQSGSAALPPAPPSSLGWNTRQGNTQPTSATPASSGLSGAAGVNAAVGAAQATEARNGGPPPTGARAGFNPISSPLSGEAGVNAALGTAGLPPNPPMPMSSAAPAAPTRTNTAVNAADDNVASRGWQWNEATHTWEPPAPAAPPPDTRFNTEFRDDQLSAVPTSLDIPQFAHGGQAGPMPMGEPAAIMGEGLEPGATGADRYNGELEIDPQAFAMGLVRYGERPTGTQPADGTIYVPVPPHMEELLRREVPPVRGMPMQEAGGGDFQPAEFATGGQYGPKPMPLPGEPGDDPWRYVGGRPPDPTNGNIWAQYSPAQRELYGQQIAAQGSGFTPADLDAYYAKGWAGNAGRGMPMYS